MQPVNHYWILAYIFLDEEEYDSQGDKVYEELSGYSSQGSPTDEAADSKAQKKLSTLEMFGKKGTVLRALWAEMPEVKSDIRI